GPPTSPLVGGFFLAVARASFQPAAIQPFGSGRVSERRPAGGLPSHWVVRARAPTTALGLLSATRQTRIAASGTTAAQTLSTLHAPAGAPGRGFFSERSRCGRVVCAAPAHAPRAKGLIDPAASPQLLAGSFFARSE